MRALAGVAAGVLALVGYPAYLRSVAAGRVRPALGSWWAWFVTALIVTSAQIAASSGWGMTSSVAQTFGLGAVLFAARGRSFRLDGLDLACIAMGVGGAVAGLLMGAPDLAVAVAIAGAILAGTPTYLSVLRRPESEAPTLWLCCGLSGGLSAWAGPALTMADAGFGVYLLVANVAIGLAACRRPRRRSGGPSRGRPVAPALEASS